MSRKRCFCLAPLRPDGTCSDPYCKPEYRAPHKRQISESRKIRDKAEAERYARERGFPNIEKVRAQLKRTDPKYAARCQRIAERRRRRPAEMPS